jgi:hypothetical protein
MAAPSGKKQPHHGALASPPHIVKFYDPHIYPATEIADYFLTGIDAGESALLIATLEHSTQIKQSLASRGLDGALLTRLGMLFCEDAEEMLESLRARTGMREDLLNAVLRNVIHSVLALAPNGKVRVFGELVDLLVARGDFSSCIRLEREWHRLVAELQFPLYCAYSNAGFDERSAGQLCAICDSHDQVRVDGEGTSVWLKVLQERSQALQMAIAERKATERELRLWETACANLFELLLERWQDREVPAVEIRQEAITICGRDTDGENVVESLDEMAESGLQEILQACADACDERRRAIPGGEDWYKSTGKIVAYGNLTAALQRLLERLDTLRGN